MMMTTGVSLGAVATTDKTNLGYSESMGSDIPTTSSNSDLSLVQSGIRDGRKGKFALFAQFEQAARGLRWPIEIDITRGAERGDLSWKDFSGWR
jgi:hypothetical protein